MKINLITPTQHAELLNIFNNAPILTLQNKGYEGIDRSKFTDKENQQDKKVDEILKSAIVGFRRFQNFKLDKDNNIVLRFQYNYDYETSLNAGFTGVGYILLDELLNGFNS